MSRTFKRAAGVGAAAFLLASCGATGFDPDLRGWMLKLHAGDDDEVVVHPRLVAPATRPVLDPTHHMTGLWPPRWQADVVKQWPFVDPPNTAVFTVPKRDK